MSWIEIIAVIFSISYTILAIKENIWCWAAAVVSVSLYFYICIDAQLYAESGLQVFYMFMNGYGFYQWKYGKNHNELPLTEWSLKTHSLIILGGGLGIYLLGSGLIKFTDAALPFLDSFTTVFSIIATYLVTKKVVSNWGYWVVIDAISIYLYYSRGFTLTAGLFFVYTLLAIWGLFQWKNDYAKTS